MEIIDGNRHQTAATIDSDVCIVGSGPAGMTIAAELDRSDQSVVLVESGDFGPDEQTQALYDIAVVGHPMRENFMSRARYFGGTSNLWAGRAMWLTRLDLQRRDWIPHSGWPIAFDELSDYYTAAARILKLPSSAELARVLARSRTHAVERRLTENDDLQLNISAWSKQPRRFGPAYRSQLRASHNVSVYVNTNVIDVQLNRAGNRVESCVASTLGGRTMRFTARRFVLACGGLETARLLLASRSIQPNGIGNDHDAVGRYYMDHPRAVFGRVKFSTAQKLPSLLGVPIAGGMAQVGLQLSDEIQAREQLLNTYATVERYWSDQAAQAYQSFVHSAKVVLRKGHAGRRFGFSRPELAKVPELIYLLAPRELMPHSLYRVARQVKDTFGRGVTDLIVVTYCEQPPNPHSRVYLGQDRDRFGMPKLAVNWVIGTQETRTLMRLHELVDDRLRRSGLGRLDHGAPDSPFGDLRYTDASHHVGTTRMSTSPHDGVVDEHCRVHGVANLFVAGSGVFPTSGHANPTLTIVALAVRLAARLNSTRA